MEWINWHTDKTTTAKLNDKSGSGYMSDHCKTFNFAPIPQPEI